MLKPLHDHIVLEVIKQEKSTKSGIILTQDDKDLPTIGKVVEVGPGLYKDGAYQPMHVKVGDKVIFKKYSTTDIQLEGKEYLIVRESDILAMVKE
ncbi:MAG: co-chaperone GroES [Candidatus Izemoplasma sp.]|nr:co-chaperone GroES [Candidatus Izemoplasma sp.]